MPHPLNQQIDRLTARLRRQGWLTGWSLFVVVLIGVATLLIGFDYATRWSDASVRWLASGAWLAAVGWSAHRFLIHPRGNARRPDHDEVAHRVQQRFPELGSRLTSSLEFLQQEENDPAAGSAELRRAVIAQTQTDASQVDLNDVVDPQPFRRAAAGLGWLAAGVAILTLVQPAAVATGLTRLAAPWSSIDWPRRHRLAFVDPPTRLARGRDFEAVLVDERADPPADVQITYRFESSGGSRIERRAPQSSGDRLLAIIEDVQQSFSYRATGGDDHAMPWNRVEVIDPPKLIATNIRAAPPAYTGAQTATVGPDVRVLAGTTLHIEAATESKLTSAKLLIGQDRQSKLRIATVEGTPRGAIVTPPEGWTAEADEPTNAPYRFLLEGADGIAGETPPHRLRIEPDTPPQVEWRSPESDAFVTAGAVIRLSVLAEDNLAVKRVRVLIADESRADESSTEGETSSIEPVLMLAGPEQPPKREHPLFDGPADRQAPELDWDLATLNLPVGATLELTAEAEDYRPGVGRAPVPRRVIIISTEELNQRIADSQSQLLHDLQQALTAQRDAREKNRGIADAARDPESEKQSLLDRLSTLGFDQRRIAEQIDDPQRGVARQAERLIDELDRNRADRPSLASQLRRIADAARQLADRPLPEAARGVVDAQRSAESDDRQRVTESLSKADQRQTEVVDTLEQLTEELAGWSDLEQFANELADLKQRQEQLAGSTQAEAAKSAAARRTPGQRNQDRRRLAETQSELARRFDKLMRSMRRRLDAAEDRDAPAGERLAPVEDTLAEANDRATAGKLRDATRQVREGRLGRAGEAQQDAVKDLEQLLETLRNRASGDPAQLAQQLRDAQRRLGELQDQLERLDKSPPRDARRRAQQEERLAKATERLSRRLDRLTADQASNAAKAGAEKMADAAQQSQQEQAGGAQESRQQAEQQLRLAEQQIEERIRQLENEAAQRLLDQLAIDVQDYLERQRRLLEQTVELAENTAPGSDALKRDAQPLAGRQDRLGEKVDASAEKFTSRKVFSIALSNAAEQMGAAADRLDGADPGQATQRHELEAIERLKHIADALTSTPPDDQPNENQQQPGEGQGGQQQQRPPPPFDVAELKMLRLMQLDLNDRTRQFETNAVEGLEAERRRQGARRLAAEQRELADLVQELLNRNNKDPRLKPPEEVL